MHHHRVDELRSGRHAHPIQEVGFRHEVEGWEVKGVHVVVGLQGVPFPASSADEYCEFYLFWQRVFQHVQFN